MKKCLLFDIIDVAVCILLYIILRLIFGSNLLITILVPALGMIAYYVFNIFKDNKEDAVEASYEFRMNKVNEENKTMLNNCIRELNELAKYSYFEPIIKDFLSKIDTFGDKEIALKRLIEMNGNEGKRFLLERTQAVQSYIIANAQKLIKCFITYNAQSKSNRPKDVNDLKVVCDVRNSMNALTENYDRLLEEVSFMGSDGFNPEDPGIKDVVENLQEIRNTTHVDDDVEEDNEIHLFVSKTQQ